MVAVEEYCPMREVLGASPTGVLWIVPLHCLWDSVVACYEEAVEEYLG